jgi:hypothetical protein
MIVFDLYNAFGTHGIAETSFIIDSCIFSYGDRLTVTVPFHSPAKKQIIFHETRKFTSARKSTVSRIVDLSTVATGIYIAQENDRRPSHAED